MIVKHHSFLFYIFFLSFLFYSATSQEQSRSNFTFSESPQEFNITSSERFHYFDGYIGDTSKNEYLKIQLLPTKVENYAFIYISAIEETPLYNTSDYKSIEPESFILIPKSYFSSKQKVVLTVEGRNSSDYTLIVQAVNDVYLEDGLGVDLVLNPSVVYSFKYNVTHNVGDSIMFTALGPNVLEPTVNITYNNKVITPKQIFNNGKGIMLTQSEHGYTEGTEFTLNIKVTATSLMQIGVKQVSNDGNAVTIRPKDQVVLVMDNKVVKKMCYSILALDNIKTGDDSTWKYIVNAKSYTQNARFYVYDTKAQKEITGKDIITSGYMVFDYKATDQLCIKANEVSAKEISSTFQILDLELLTEYQPYHEALIRGITYEEYLPAGSVMFYRIPSLSVSSSQIEMNIHFIKGYPVLYKGYCNNYPDCHFKPEDIATLEAKGEITSAHDINENIYLIEQAKGTTIYKEAIQTVAIVYCPNDPVINDVDCIFDISLQNEGDTANLLPDTRVNRPILKSERDKYSFEITNDNTQSIVVGLYSYSGDADLTVSLEPSCMEEYGTYEAIGNRETVTITRSDMGSLLGKYYIEVYAAKNAYYSLYYSPITDMTEKSFTVPPGEMFMETITKRQQSRIFYMSNRNIENKVPYLISISSVNCNIDVTFRSKKYSERNYQFIVHPTDEEYNSGKYKFEVSLVSFDSKSESDSEVCMFYIAGDESINENELLLNEGIYHSMHLNKDVNQLTYIYPFIYSNQKEGVTFSITKQSEMNIKLNYNFQGRERREMIVREMHRKIRLEITEIDEHCTFGEPCPLIITVEPEYTITDKSITLPFKIEVLASAGIPSFLTLGEMRFSKLTSVPHYYYTDLSKNEEAEIIIDFLYGSGSAVAKIVKKDAPAEPLADWNKRVRLPDENMKDVIHIDHYDKKFTITKSMLSECDNGCEVYIKVYPEHESGSYEIDEYSILIRQYDTITKIDVNEIVTNTIHTTIYNNPRTAYNYYTTTVTKDTDRVIFDVDCDLCAVFINVDSDAVPTAENNMWMFTSSDKMFTIYESDPLIKRNNLKNKVFTIGVAALSLDGDNGAYYNMKVLTPDRNVDIIHTITSAHDQICDIKKHLGKCYLLFPIQAESAITDVFVYAINEGVNSTAVQIFAKFFDAKDLDMMSPEVKIQNFPSFSYNDYTSSETTTPSLLRVPVTEKAVDRYLAVTIHSQRKVTLKVISTLYKTPLVSSFRPHSDELFVLNSGDSIEILLKGNAHYFTEFVCLLGEMEVKNTKDNETSLLSYERQPGLGGFIDPGDIDVSYIVTATYTHSLVLFFTRYTSVTSKGKFTRLRYGRENYLEYPSGNPFPIEYYTNVEDETNDIAVNLNFKKYTKIDSKHGVEGFKLKGAVVSEEFIINRKANQIEIDESIFNANTRYIESMRTGQFVFSKQNFSQINSTTKYLYLYITPDDTNKHNYTQIATSLTLIPSNVGFVTLPINEYYHGVVNKDLKRVIFKLTKQSIEHTYLDVEISCNGAWNFSMNPADQFIIDIDYNKNNTDIELIYFDEEGGKYIFVFNMMAWNTVHLALLTNEQRDLDYVVKYRTSKEQIEHFSLPTPNLELVKKDNDQLIDVSVPAIHHKTMFLINNAYYTLQIYDGDKFISREDVDILQPRHPPIFESSNFTSKDKIITFSDIPYDKNQFVYINVLAVGRDGSTSEMLLYETISNRTDVNKRGIIWFVLGALMLIGCSVGLYFLFKKIKDGSGNDDYKNVNDIQSKLDIDDI